MSQPKLEIEKRVERCEKAIGTMAQWLVQAQTGFGVQDAEGIEKILRGEDDASSESEGRPSVRDEGEGLQGQGVEEEGGETGQGHSSE